jgi:hypothetical protein
VEPPAAADQRMKLSSLLSGGCWDFGFKFLSYLRTDGGGFRDFYHNRTNPNFTTAEKKILETCRSIVPNFNND